MPTVYTSPIPITPTHFGHAVASEWTKLRSLRSTMWTLGLMFVFVIGLGLLVSSTIEDRDLDDAPILSFGLPGVLLGQLSVVTLGALVITSEYSTGMIRTTLTACPQRGRVLAAKALVFSSVTLVLCTAAASLVALINYSAFEGRTITEYHDGGPMITETGADTGEVVRATLGVGLYMALLGLLALAVGALLRHTAGSVTAMLGVVLLPLLTGLFVPNEDVAEALQEYSAPNILGQLYGIPIIGDDNGWGLLGLLAAVTAGMLVAASASLHSRDV